MLDMDLFVWLRFPVDAQVHRLEQSVVLKLFDVHFVEILYVLTWNEQCLAFNSLSITF